MVWKDCVAVCHCHPIYIGWSDVTYLWSQCDRHFVGQHVVLCAVKWWRYVALFESNWISRFKKMSVLRYYRYYWETDVCWRQNNKHFAELAPTKWRKTADMKKLRHCHPMYIMLSVRTAVPDFGPNPSLMLPRIEETSTIFKYDG